MRIFLENLEIGAIEVKNSPCSKSWNNKGDILKKCRFLLRKPYTGLQIRSLYDCEETIFRKRKFRFGKKLYRGGLVIKICEIVSRNTVSDTLINQFVYPHSTQRMSPQSRRERLKEKNNGWNTRYYSLGSSVF